MVIRGEDRVPEPSITTLSLAKLLYQFMKSMDNFVWWCTIFLGVQLINGDISSLEEIRGGQEG
jgi:hypothetical protein